MYRQRQRGFVSLLILLVLTFLCWQGFTVFVKVDARAKMVQSEAQVIRASYAADSGLEYAKVFLKHDPTWKKAKLPLSGGEVTITVLERGLGFRITARAQIGKTVQMRYADYDQGGEGDWILKNYGEL